MTRDGELQRALRAIADRAGREIRARRTKIRGSAATRTALPLLLVFPSAYALYELLRWIGGGAAAPLSPWLLLLGTVAVPLLWIVGAALSTWRRPVDHRDSLATVDRALDLQNRLQSADEFLRGARRSAFAQAAIEDAAEHVERARAAELALDPARTGAFSRRLAYALPAAALCALAWWLGGVERQPFRAIADDPPLQVAGLTPRAAPEEPQPQSDAVVPVEQPRPRSQQRPSLSAEVASKALEEVAEGVKESRGSTGLGQAAEASSARGSSSSKAAPSNQGQSAKVQPRAQKATPKKEPKAAPPPAQAPPQKKSAEESGTTAGRGASKGSNRNPASSEWSSKDHVQTPEDAAVENDEDIEDEEEEQESRGGIQPNLRDRKPPVNRDLRIGFGNRKNPDANGRGGPSEQKKSRGVASLVLGVPIPDRIKGQPNPGKTKITQERIEPKAEDAESIIGESRTPRGAPIGHLTPRALPLWMRDLVKNYFLSQRTPSNDP